MKELYQNTNKVGSEEQMLDKCVELAAYNHTALGHALGIPTDPIPGTVVRVMERVCRLAGRSRKSVAAACQAGTPEDALWTQIAAAFKKMQLDRGVPAGQVILFDRRKTWAYTSLFLCDTGEQDCLTVASEGVSHGRQSRRPPRVPACSPFASTHPRRSPPPPHTHPTHTHTVPRQGPV
jgi:hypothetical protein